MPFSSVPRVYRAFAERRVGVYRLLVGDIIDERESLTKQALGERKAAHLL